MATLEAKIVHTTINRDWREVYAFMAKHENMHRWASGLSSGLTRNGEDWLAPGPLGDARVRFAPTTTSASSIISSRLPMAPRFTMRCASCRTATGRR